jgi:hypothetical protein
VSEYIKCNIKCIFFEESQIKNSFTNVPLLFEVSVHIILFQNLVDYYVRWGIKIFQALNWDIIQKRLGNMGLEVNAEKPKYMLLFCYQNAGQNDDTDS